MIRVSVILCCYNGERFIRQALQSAYRQTLSQDQYEVLFVNDGSTDATAEIARAFHGYRHFRYLENSRNAGLPASCNRGLEAAQGDYVIRLDADDTFEPSLLEACCVELDRGVTDLVYSDRFEHSAGSSQSTVRSLETFNLYDLIAIGTMMRRQLLMDIGGYRDTFWEEYDVYIRYLLRSQKLPHRIPRPLLTYVLRPGSMTSDPGRVKAGWEDLKKLWPEETLRQFGELPAVASEQVP